MQMSDRHAPVRARLVKEPGRGKALLRRCSKGKARPLVTTVADGGKGGGRERGDGRKQASGHGRKGSGTRRGPGAAVGVVRP